MPTIKWFKPLSPNGTRRRRTFVSWQVPVDLRRKFDIADGDYADIIMRFGKVTRKKALRVTSDGELLVGINVAQEISGYARKNPRESVAFNMRIPRDPLKLLTVVRDIKDAEKELRNLKATVRNAIIDARVGQGRFRQKLLRAYDRRCAVTGIAIPELLRASHIKPWCKSNNEERLSVDNGLLLVANLDAAFDALLISFSDEGTMLFHENLGPKPYLALGITAGSTLSRRPSAKQKEHLAHHRRAAGLN